MLVDSVQFGFNQFLLKEMIKLPVEDKKIYFFGKLVYFCGLNLGVN